MLELCRICGETTQGTIAKNLFEGEQKIFIHQVELLTGEWLEYGHDLPAHICICCEQDLNVAAAFRERCIRTQKQLRQEKTKAEAKPEKFDPLGSFNRSVVTDIKSEMDTNDEEDELDDIKEELHTSDLEYDYDDLNEDDLDSFFADEETFLEQQEEQQLAEPQHEYQQTEQQTEGISKAEAVAIKILNQIKVAKEKPSGKKKYINWKKLSEDEARELKRLQRKRDCVCDQCGRHFNDPSNLKLHLLRHTGVKNYKCEVCNAKFYTAHLLKRHGLMHTGAPIFACQYCDKTFIYNNFRLKHERSHMKERRYQCEYCEKRFVSSTQRKEHEVVHTRIRKFYCEMCDQHFLRRTHLRAHYRSKTHKSNELKS